MLITGECMLVSNIFLYLVCWYGIESALYPLVIEEERTEEAIDLSKTMPHEQMRLLGIAAAERTVVNGTTIYPLCIEEESTEEVVDLSED